MDYQFSKIENEWQRYWAKHKTFKVDIDPGKPKYYVLDMFPYPSGAGLHVGHPLGYIASDIFARYKRLKGFNVLHPMGYDSFGLPAEQYAIQTGQHPAITTEKNIETYRRQLDQLGFSFDWDREVRTSSPDFYKWTQWIFMQLFNAWYNKETDKAEPINTLIEKFETVGTDHIYAVCDEDVRRMLPTDWSVLSNEEKQAELLKYRLAYLRESTVNWCAALGTVLANDEVKDGFSERGGYPVEQKKMMQWSMRITAYADRLLQGLDTIDWPEAVKEMQRNWIGKSVGVSVKFEVESQELEATTYHSIEVFTTRVDTIFGVTFLVLAPEHELVSTVTTPQQKGDIEAYITKAKNKSERDRMADTKVVTGAFTGSFAINPVNGENVQIWIADYVLAGYGTGAVMAVPSGDQRDYLFAKKFNLPVIPILDTQKIDEEADHTKEGRYINSGFIDGMNYAEAVPALIKFLEEKELGKGKTQFRMRDAIFGRQRYWGEPVPVYFKDNLPFLLDKNELPLVLPEVDKYLPTESGEPPLARAADWKYSLGKSLTPNPSPGERGAKAGNTGEDNFASKKTSPFGGGLEGVEEGSPAKTSPAAYRETADPLHYDALKTHARENRKKATEAEDALWQELRKEKTDYKFRRQHVIDNFITDFVCLQKSLVVEVDGDYHLTMTEEDRLRTAVLEKQGFTVIRFTNQEVLSSLPDVIAKIKVKLGELPDRKDVHSLTPNPSPGERGAQAEESNDVNPAGSEASPSGGGLEGVENAFFDYEKSTMPGWAGSSWYWYRYMDAKNEHEFASKESIDYWKDVDLYIGGSEHATGHLLYSRFWNKFLKDMGYVPEEEPFKKLINQGHIQGRSNLVHMLQFAQTATNLSNPENYINTNLFVSTHIAKGILNGSLDRDQIFDLINTQLGDDYLKKYSNPTMMRIHTTYADVNIVDNDILDLEKFKKWRPEYADAKFILEEGSASSPSGGGREGVYICGVEIEKMSKSKYNVVNPDVLVERYGADTLRLYEMFLGPLEQSKPWNTNGVEGVSKFLRRFWKLYHDEGNNFAVSDAEPIKAEWKSLHKIIKKAEEDIERFSFNTSVSSFMICVNELSDLKCNKREILEPLAIVISPYAPHICEELWHLLGHENSITFATFPTFKPEYLIENEFNYPISFNGKVRTNISMPLDLSNEDIEKQVLADEHVQKQLDGKPPKKIIVVKGRIVNLVI